MNSPLTLTVEQAAHLLGVSGNTIRKQINEGVFAFPSRKTGKSFIIPARPILEFFELESLPSSAQDLGEVPA